MKAVRTRGDTSPADYLVQSLQGISHNKIEDTREEHLALAVEAYARLAARAAAWILRV